MAMELKSSEFCTLIFILGMGMHISGKFDN